MPLHRAVTLHATHEGNLTLTEGHDRELRRSVRSANLRHPDDGSDVLPKLRDAVVIWIGDGKLTLSGFETDDITSRSVAQSWYIELNERQSGTAD